MADKVKFGKIVNATIRVTNDNDEQREYVITADVTVGGKNADNFNNGNVYGKGGTDTLATFSAYGDSNRSVNYTTSDDETNVAIYNAISAFISDVRQKVAETDTLNIQ